MSSLPSLQTIDLDHRPDGVLIATLDRPDRLNALSFDMFEDLRTLGEHLRDPYAARVLVLTGRGRAFCAGFDYDEVVTVSDMSAEEMLIRQERWADTIGGFSRLPIPVIAALNGATAGGGMSLALTADLRIAATSSFLTTAFVKIAISGGDMGMSWLLPRIVGLGRASDLLLTARRVAAAEALELGLVNRVVVDRELLPAALTLAEELVETSAEALRLTKQVLHRNVDASSLQAALELENRNQVLVTRGSGMKAAVAARQQKPTDKW